MPGPSEERERVPEDRREVERSADHAERVESHSRPAGDGSGMHTDEGDDATA